MLQNNDFVPEFHATDHKGRPVAIPDLAKRGPVVIYFYPFAFSLTCTPQTCSFRDSYLEFKSLGAEVVGVSMDPVETHRQFALEYLVPFPLVSDADRQLVDIFDVMHFHKLFLKRVTFVIDQQMKIRGVFHHEINLLRHVKEVRTVLLQLKEERTNEDARSAREKASVLPGKSKIGA